jgi:hypothetical protein
MAKPLSLTHQGPRSWHLDLTWSQISPSPEAMHVGNGYEAQLTLPDVHSVFFFFFFLIKNYLFIEIHFF